MNQPISRQEIENMKVGDYFPNIFGKLKKITNIYAKQEDTNGKLFCCFYQEFGKDSKMSNSVKEGRIPYFLNKI